MATGEGDKAGRWILEAAEGIAKEDLLLSMILRHGGDAQQPEQLTMRFYLICVQLLEQAGLSTAALGVAQVALKNGRKDDPLVPTLWSIVAKLHLHLAHYQVLFGLGFFLPFYRLLFKANCKLLIYYRSFTDALGSTTFCMVRITFSESEN